MNRTSVGRLRNELDPLVDDMLDVDDRRLSRVDKICAGLFEMLEWISIRKAFVRRIARGSRVNVGLKKQREFLFGKCSFRGFHAGFK